MIITTIKNNKLFIKFDSLVKEGVIHLVVDHDFKTQQNIMSSDFEVMDLPSSAQKINIQIETDEKRITKTITLKN